MRSWSPGRTYPQLPHLEWGSLTSPQLGQSTVCFALSARCDRRRRFLPGEVRCVGSIVAISWLKSYYLSCGYSGVFEYGVFEGRSSNKHSMPAGASLFVVYASDVTDRGWFWIGGRVIVRAGHERECAVCEASAEFPGNPGVECRWEGVFCQAKGGLGMRLWGTNDLILWWFGICCESILHGRGLDWCCLGFGGVIYVLDGVAGVEIRSLIVC